MRKSNARTVRARLVRTTLVCIALTGSLLAQSFQVKTTTLKNGLKILVQEDQTIPNVAFYTFYRIGSRNERTGATGLAHFFEHMMFNGAKKYGPGEFDRVMEAAGGTNNAYTNNDVTVYQDWFPKTALELIFDLEADRIQYLAFDPKIVESERGVVYSERRLSVDNNNDGLLNEQLYAAAFTAHPYHWPVIGWPSDIEHWTMADLKTYHQMGYSPSNATIVVVGAVNADEVFALARKYLEPIPAHEPPPPVTTVEPTQSGERRVYVRKFAQLPQLQVGYHVGNTKSSDFYARQLLVNILSTGQSSRLYRAFVESGLAIEAGAGQNFTFDPTLFEFQVKPKQGVSIDKIEHVLYAELDKLANTPVDASELQKAKNQAISSIYQQLESVNGRANTIGTYEVFFGDYNKLFNAEKEFDKVTPADIQKLVKEQFSPMNRTVAILVPEAQQETKAEGGEGEKQ
jgi:zinc protease